MFQPTRFWDVAPTVKNTSELRLQQQVQQQQQHLQREDDEMLSRHDALRRLPTRSVDHLQNLVGGN